MESKERRVVNCFNYALFMLFMQTWNVPAVSVIDKRKESFVSLHKVIRCWRKNGKQCPRRVAGWNVSRCFTKNGFIERDRIIWSWFYALLLLQHI